MTVAIAFDGGSTGTRAGLYEVSRRLLAECKGPPTNPILVGREESLVRLVALARTLLRNHGSDDVIVAAGISGCGTLESRDDFAACLGGPIGARRVVVSDDLRPVLFANVGSGPAVMVIAGTGSSVVAQAPGAGSILVGGRGSVFGDDGSAYQIGVSALRAAARAVDGLGPDTALVEALIGAAGQPGFSSMPAWTAAAGKHEIASLAKMVADVAKRGDAVAATCIVEQAQRLAAQTEAAQRMLHLTADAPFLLHGGMFEECPRFRIAFEERLVQLAPDAAILPPELTGHRAVVEMVLADSLPQEVEATEVELNAGEHWQPTPTTEACLGVTRPLDRMSASDIVAVMSAQDRRAAEAVSRVAGAVTEVIELVAACLRSGGRLVYVGAGTSGRLGVLDASECPPTFGVSPDRVVGIVSGGDRALRESIEGAEDDPQQAEADLAGLEPAIGAGDVVVGISASGTTPYTLSALAHAASRGAATVLIHCNPGCAVPADVRNEIALDTGPEVLAGSTRLKAGTATKMVLNMISTGAMALSGHVFEGRMVGLRPVNAKLRRRAARIVAALTHLPDSEAQALLDAASGRIPVAVIMAIRGMPADAAEEHLDRCRGHLREALGAWSAREP